MASVFSWGRWIGSVLGSGPRKSKTSLKRLRRAGRRPSVAMVSRLEPRVLLTVLTVNSLADDTTAGDGLVTLREAIGAANTDTATDLGQAGAGVDEIVFAPGLAGTIFLTGGEIGITSGLSIKGNGAASTG